MTASSPALQALQMRTYKMLSEPKVNILIVDDRPENLIALESVLEDLEQNLVRASSGMEALKCVLNQDFAVILLDVQMPGMDGFETATLLRSREKSRHIPLLFLTAINKSPVHVFQGYSVGAIEYLFKPFDPGILKAKVAAFIEMSRNVTRLREEIVQRMETEARLDASNALLETISRASMQFISDGNPSRAFEHILQTLLVNTDSDSGFIGELVHSDVERPHMQYYALGENGQCPTQEIKSGHRSRSLFENTNMDALCRAIKSMRRPLIAQDQTEFLALNIGSGDGGLPQNLMALPIYNGEQLVGVIGVANSLNGYSQSYADSLEPMCSACASIIEGYRNSQRRQQAEKEVRKLNEELECRVEERTSALESSNQYLQVEIVQHQLAKEVLARHQQHIEALNERLRRSMTESHHRVKNNLQVVAAMLDLRLMDETPSIPSSDIQQLVIHVRSLAMVHDLLTHESKEGDGKAQFISMRTLLHELIPMLEATTAERPIQYDIAEVRLSAQQGTSLALVVNELVTNALKYGKGAIGINLTMHDGEAQLEVVDDGPGFPSGFDPVTASNTGLDLVMHLSQWDLGAKITFQNRTEGGARIRVCIPVAEVPFTPEEQEESQAGSALCSMSNSPVSLPARAPAA